MLKITIPGDELFDEENNRFIKLESVTLELEHSLASLSKWESIWETPFLSGKNQTTEEILGYIKVMTLTPDVPDEVYERLTQANIQDINAYINAKMTATWFNETGGKSNKETITSELIYYWMITLNIPFECEHWHLNRLFTLIKVCNEKNQPPKKTKMTRQDIASRSELNRRRREALGTKG